MQLISYSMKDEAGVGAVVGDGVVDLGRRLGGNYGTMKSLIAQGDLTDVKGAVEGAEPDYRYDEVTLLPVVPDASKIVCIGLNYKAHAAETTRDPNDKPMLFARWADTLIAHKAPLIQPRISQMLDYEAEMLAVIGSHTGRNVKAADALKYVFGYSCMNEGSVRDWQRHSSQVTAGKNFVGTGATGPWIVTADEIPDPQVLDIDLTVNGEPQQTANTRDMIWSVAEMIEYITNWMPLGPGDLIATGTPAGVGSMRKPPIFLQPGDKVEVSISGIGTLSNIVEAENG
ncbi:MAG: fumarylacetoacetate hydrolase family protein [Tropicimonas sp.]|uniref:fumarylacetoacetate hydrolase family protein n=1 Tax=Tropicimonas sp. TaxID=2067044 RepID=UPI003A8BA07B